MDCTLESSSSQHSTPDPTITPPAIINRHPAAQQATVVATASSSSSTSSLSPSSSMHKDSRAAGGTTVPPKSQKRVHFSTQNSMVQVPRADSFHYIEPAAVPPLNHYSHHYQQHHVPPHHQSHHQHQFSYESVYSNEYEPIGSEGTCSVATTNHYVDMDSKHYAPAAAKPGNRSSQTTSGAAVSVLPEPSLLPPALPPKPSNLMKIRNVPRLKHEPLMPTTTAVHMQLGGGQSGHNNSDTDTEPDYASILEIGPIPSRQTSADPQPAPAPERLSCQVQVLADVHQEAVNSSSSSSSSKSSLLDGEQNVASVHQRVQKQCDISESAPQITDDFGFMSAEDDETSFADVPKLPNVAAIISPKKEQTTTTTAAAVITQDNYITRSGQTLPIMAEVSTTSPVAGSQQTTSALPPKVLTKNVHNRQQQQRHQPTQLVPQALAKQSLKMVVTPSAALYEDKLRIQAEFDWYNLDVEYSGAKSSKMLASGHASDRVNEDDKDDDDEDDDENNVGDGHDEVINHLMLMSANESKDAQSFGVEYKLDEEFSYSNGPYTNALMRMHSTPNGAGSGNTNDGSAHFVGRSLSHATDTIPEDDRDEDDDDDVDGGDPKNGTIGEQILPATTTPKMRRIGASMRHCDSAADAFETFLSETGLATKPLPRKRRIFY